MEIIQVFLKLDVSNSFATWEADTRAFLDTVHSIEGLQIVYEKTQDAHLSFSYHFHSLQFDHLAKSLEISGAKITELTFQFPSEITGVADPYGASGISLLMEDSLGKIKGVLAVGVSALGNIKVQINPASSKKQDLIESIKQTITSK